MSTAFASTVFFEIATYRFCASNEIIIGLLVTITQKIKANNEPQFLHIIAGIKIKTRKWNNRGHIYFCLPSIYPPSSNKVVQGNSWGTTAQFSVFEDETGITLILAPGIICEFHLHN